MENEAAILRTVKDSGVTVLLISHRPNAVAVADEVYVLERGVVVGQR